MTFIIVQIKKEQKSEKNRKKRKRKKKRKIYIYGSIFVIDMKNGSSHTWRLSFVSGFY